MAEYFLYDVSSFCQMEDIAWFDSNTNPHIRSTNNVMASCW